MSLNFSEIEAKWQAKWDERKAFCAEAVSSKPKYYALDMFPCILRGQGCILGILLPHTCGYCFAL